jgi:hypothetical protein
MLRKFLVMRKIKRLLRSLEIDEQRMAWIEARLEVFSDVDEIRKKSGGYRPIYAFEGEYGLHAFAELHFEQKILKRAMERDRQNLTAYKNELHALLKP